MSTMNIILPESLKDFVESKVKDGSCSTNSEYVKALIRKDLEREKFRNILLSIKIKNQCLLALLFKSDLKYLLINQKRH